MSLTHILRGDSREKLRQSSPSRLLSKLGSGSDPGGVALFIARATTTHPFLFVFRRRRGTKWYGRSSSRRRKTKKNLLGMPPSINRPPSGVLQGTQKNNLNHLLKMWVMKREDCRTAKTWRSVGRFRVAKRLGVRQSPAVFRRTKSDQQF